MTRCRLHILLPDDREISGETKYEKLEAAFNDQFDAEPEAAVQDSSPELVSSVFEETAETMAAVEQFEETCTQTFPEADILHTRQHRDVMDGQASEYGYDEAIMLTVTNALVSK